MAKIKSWEVSDSFWERVEPLIPKPQRNLNVAYKRKPGGGRKPIPPRRIFEAIMYVLRTGCQWKALPKEIYGSPSAIHAHRLVNAVGSGSPAQTADMLRKEKISVSIIVFIEYAS